MTKKLVVGLAFLFVFAGMPFFVSAQTAPTVSLTANPTTISIGQNTTLTWTSQDATQCITSASTYDPVWNGDSAVLSGWRTVGLRVTNTYTLTCSNAAGSTSQSVTVPFVTSSAPTQSATPTITSLTPNQGTFSGTGSISGTGLSAVATVNFYLNGQLYSSVFPSNLSDSSLTFQFPGYAYSGSTNSVTFQIKVTSQAGTSNSLDYTLNAPSSGQVSQVPQVTMAIGPASIQSGQSATLILAGTNDAACNTLMIPAENRQIGWQSQTANSNGGVSYSAVVTPTKTTTYQATCYYIDSNGQSASRQFSVTVTVNGQSVPTQAPVVDIKVNGSDSIKLTSVSQLSNPVTVTWSTTPALPTTTCSAWDGNESSSGSKTVVPGATVGNGPLYGYFTEVSYQISCTDSASGLTGSDNATVDVQHDPNAPYSLTGTNTNTTYANTDTNPVTTTGTTTVSLITVTTPISAMTADQKQALITQIKALLAQLIAELNTMIAQGAQ